MAGLTHAGEAWHADTDAIELQGQGTVLLTS